MQTNSFIVEPKSKEKIEKEAEQILRLLCPKHLTEPGELDVEDFFVQAEKIYGVKLELDNSIEVLGSYDPATNTIHLPEKTYLAACTGNWRARFTVIHELYHAIKHRDQLLNPNIELLTKELGKMRTLNREKPRSYVYSEWQADYGAGAILIPKITLLPFLDSLKGFADEEIIDAVSSTYTVSWKCAEVRLDKLEVIKNERS